MIELWTDGSCNHKSKLGGIGILCLKDRRRLFKKGIGFKNTTISRMEIWAVLIGLLKILELNLQNEEIVVYSDSMLVINAVKKEWIKSWSLKAFYNIKNSELWIYMNALLTEFKDIDFVHVKGHSGITNNEICDFLANYKRFSKHYLEGEITLF